MGNMLTINFTALGESCQVRVTINQGQDETDDAYAIRKSFWANSQIALVTDVFNGTNITWSW